MPQLPALTGWETTGPQLHAAAQILGALRVLAREHVPNYLELALRIERDGLSTDVLAAGGTVQLSWSRAALVSQRRQGDVQTFPLNGRLLADVLETLLATLGAISERPPVGNRARRLFRHRRCVGFLSP